MRFLFLFLLFCTLALRAQEPASTQQIIEDIVAERDAEFDLDEIIDNLEIMRLSPLDLNAADEEELSKLIFLSPEQIQALINYRRWNGLLGSIYELKAVPYFDLSTIGYILPYVKVGDGKPESFRLSRALKYGRSQLLMRYRETLERKAGYLPDSNGESDYLGLPQQLYARYRYSYRRNLSAGITLEKDAGEPFRYGPVKVADFSSAHLFVSGAGRLEALALGDFSVNMGQGLLLWTGFGYGKSPYALSIKRTAPLINRYSSVNENRFFRGAAAGYRLGRFTLTAFVSRKKIDGNVAVADTSGSPEAFVSSFQESGLHRTPSQMEDRKSVEERAAGANISYRNENMKLGVNLLYFQFSRPLRPPDRAYNRFDFNGSRLGGASVHYEYFWRNALFFGETAMSDNGRMATLNGLNFRLDPKTSLALLYRNYDRAYQSIYASAFGEGGEVQNEEGIYIGVASEINSKMKVQAYVDVFRFPWLRFRIDRPSTGREYLFLWEYRPARNTDIYLRGRYEIKERNRSNNGEPLHRLSTLRRAGLRLHISQKINEKISLRNRLELSSYQEGEEKRSTGVMLYQDLIWHWQRKPLTLYFRYALFDTDDYDSRIYAYENDVLYSFSVPAYSGRGLRAYLLAKYRIGNGLRMEARLARFRYPYQDEIGSGSEKINGNTRTDLTLQLQWKF